MLLSTKASGEGGTLSSEHLLRCPCHAAHQTLYSSLTIMICPGSLSKVTQDSSRLYIKNVMNPLRKSTSEKKGGCPRHVNDAEMLCRNGMESTDVVVVYV